MDGLYFHPFPENAFSVIAFELKQEDDDFSV